MINLRSLFNPECQLQILFTNIVGAVIVLRGQVPKHIALKLKNNTVRVIPQMHELLKAELFLNAQIIAVEELYVIQADC